MKIKGYLKGSSTLEAAIVVPIIMLMIVLVVRTGVELQMKTRGKAEEHIENISESINSMDEKRNILYKYKAIEDVIDEIGG